MKKNIGTTDRIVRIALGAGILSLAFIGPQSSWAFLGVAPLLTGVVGWCPPYTLLGISTVKKPGSKAEPPTIAPSAARSSGPSQSFVAGVRNN